MMVAAGPPLLRRGGPHQPLAQPAHQRPLRRHHRRQPVRAGRVPHRGQQPRRGGRALDARRCRSPSTSRTSSRSAPRESLEDRAARRPRGGVGRATCSREEALRRFRALFRDLRSLPEDLGENPFPASLEVTLRPAAQLAPRTSQRLVARLRAGARAWRRSQYDLLWIQRLSTAVRLVRGVGAFLGGDPGAGRRLHDLERDPADHLRAPGRARHHAPGGRHPRLREGAVRGGGHDPGRPGRPARPGRSSGSIFHVLVARRCSPPPTSSGRDARSFAAAGELARRCIVRRGDGLVGSLGSLVSLRRVMRSV